LLLKSIIVTGGCGLICVIFLRHAVDNHPDAYITVLDKLTYTGITSKMLA
jgi:dTDP-glucose 4,6-dehydratase